MDVESERVGVQVALRGDDCAGIWVMPLGFCTLRGGVLSGRSFLVTTGRGVASSLVLLGKSAL